MLISPASKVCDVPDMAASIGNNALELKSDDLETDRNLAVVSNCGASSEADSVRWRFSSRARGQCLHARGQGSDIASGIAPDSTLETCELSGSDLEQVQPSDDQTKALETKLGAEVDQALRQRAASIILAGGTMVLIADEPAVAQALQNELLLLTFKLVQALDAPVDAPWAKRAFREKVLAMVLASAVGIGSSGAGRGGGGRSGSCDSRLQMI